MKPKKPNPMPRSTTPGSLLSPEAMGGINAIKGFDFQTRYTVCHLPLWLLEPNFNQIFFEGSGDIDLRYALNGKPSIIHFQIKDHEVVASEFKSVIEHFYKVDAESPDVYQCFKLICPALAAPLRSVEAGLARLRNAKPFYEDIPGALTGTKQDFENRLRKLKLDAHADFVERKVFIEVGHGHLQQDEHAVDLFISRVQKHPGYAKRLRDMLQPAFARLLQAIGAKRGAVLERKEIEQLLESSIGPLVAATPGVALAIHNWTKEKFDVTPDYELDWSAYFDRAIRRVPTPDTWQNILLPQLDTLKQAILKERSERLIRFRGKCTLSTGIALGMYFPTVAGWTIEMPQPPATGHWRSDAVATPDYDLRLELLGGEKNGTDMVVGLNIRGDGRDDIKRFIDSTGEPTKLFAFLSPANQGARSIAGDRDACAFAQQTRERLNVLAKEHSVRAIRLFFYGPLALAIFLGQQLTAVGEIKLFEYQDPGYVPSCNLKS